MHFVAIVGTNAKLSYNRILLRFIKDHFSDKATVDICEIKDIPMFNENVPKNDPEAVQKIAAKIESSDGVIIGCPEHNHSVPSPLKSVIEWLSYRVHPLNDKPVMIVGASYHPQGSSRAQLHLRQILDTPGVNAKVLPGNEFLLGNVKEAFDDNGVIKDQQTIKFLEDCFNEFLNFVEIHQNASATKKGTQHENGGVRWDKAYDVLVLGFGAAGATAARFAADKGAKVLLVDAAPEGHEGGNTRYAGQVVLTGYDYDKMLAYFKQLFGPIEIDEKVLSTYVDGIVHMREYFQNYLGVEHPVSYNKTHRDPDYQAFANGLSPEYPEFEGADTVDLTTVHDGYFDAALWKNLRKQVTDRSNQVDVWFASPAKHLVQDPITKAVLGAQIQRGDSLVNIRARNGVVLATGGFENNQQYIQNFIGVPKLKVIGTLYNKGDGIQMAQEAGAALWHMKSYEGYGFNTSFTFENSEEERGKFILDPWPELSQGSIFVAADDGSRYLREDEQGRHGHAYEHGSWHNPTVYEHPHLVFDEAQCNKIKSRKLPYPKFFEITVKAENLDELATKIHADPLVLEKTLKDFNEAARTGTDAAFGRSAESMKPLTTTGPFYATPLATAMLNTQGGAQRNERAEVVSATGTSIPHLYSAGEFGGINANQYNGGGNLAECLIFGKIAGENAALPKADIAKATFEDDEKTATADFAIASDLQPSSTEIKLEKNQYLGRSNAGIGGELLVRVTIDEQQKLRDVEILKQSESGDVSAEALKRIPQEMVTRNTYEVDAVSGASATSRALKAAVKDALSQIKTENQK
ncbi:fumarate reductase flavoprotein subunit [Liquorilactobacillus sucicola DSM 21376 = JCM 15457]|uniref:Urocanate reductase n=1 Tax=Liquorilactobacillus sucicola DSM 21376 = JCM 15457 TaxID=1423806 RepID=A0A023CZ25_9LACO|nr:NAD(P)H-dependent oxidoreductase [Liquorilactobacillus sucicola]KRN06603.1 fumarate reductase flavoprotein subunit [Liquorilactobacillus sucicola DSM 21376 = JCM 15457]GAJ27142.1 fumarate reductase flavoprotein subunit [Liquorilactobacillus sucicola DSM 21376 = JCM 15457]